MKYVLSLAGLAFDLSLRGLDALERKFLPGRVDLRGRLDEEEFRREWNDGTNFGG